MKAANHDVRCIGAAVLLKRVLLLSRDPKQIVAAAGLAERRLRDWRIAGSGGKTWRNLSAGGSRHQE